MKLSVVILNYNVRHFLELCLDSVRQALTDIHSEIIVVDNKSSDNSCQMIKDKFPDVILIENKENLGFSKGNNLGVSKAKGEFICILNPDTVVAEDTFKKALAFAETKSNLGIIGCCMISGDGKFLPESKRNIPTPWVAFKKIIGVDNSYYANHLQPNSSGKVTIFAGAFMLLKKKVYNGVGGFDEDYFMYGEDVDLSFKIKKAGYNSYYFGETTIIHFKGESTLKNKVYRNRFYGAMKLFYTKHLKRNVLLDALIFFAVKLAPWFSKTKDAEKQLNQDIILFSSYTNTILLEKFKNKLKLYNHIDLEMDNAKFIFDANSFSYGTIINAIRAMRGNKNALFRILPKNSDFILGSDQSESRGEVIDF